MSTQITSIVEYKEQKEDKRCILCSERQKIIELQIALDRYGNALLALMRIMNKNKAV